MPSAQFAPLSSTVRSYGNFIAVFEFSTNFFKKKSTRKQKTGRRQAKIRPSSGNFRGKTQRYHAQDAGEILSDERQIIVNFGVFGSFPVGRTQVGRKAFVEPKFFLLKRRRQEPVYWSFLRLFQLCADCQ